MNTLGNSFFTFQTIETFIVRRLLYCCLTSSVSVRLSFSLHLFFIFTSITTLTTIVILSIVLFFCWTQFGQNNFSHWFRKKISPKCSSSRKRVEKIQDFWLMNIFALSLLTLNHYFCSLISCDFQCVNKIVYASRTVTSTNENWCALKQVTSFLIQHRSPIKIASISSIIQINKTTRWLMMRNKWQMTIHFDFFFLSRLPATNPIDHLHSISFSTTVFAMCAINRLNQIRF